MRNVSNPFWLLFLNTMEKKMKKIAIILSMTILSACGTQSYIPEEYVISNERIPTINIKGNVLIENTQNDKSSVKFFSEALELVGDYQSVTTHLVKQLNKEINVHGNFINKNSEKKIQVKVTNFNAEKAFFSFKSSITVQVKLGNGNETEIKVSQNSPASVWTALNGTVALAVIDILKNKMVTDYLSN